MPAGCVLLTWEGPGHEALFPGSQQVTRSHTRLVPEPWSDSLAAASGHGEAPRDPVSPLTDSLLRMVDFPQR